MYQVIAMSDLTRSACLCWHLTDCTHPYEMGKNYRNVDGRYKVDASSGSGEDAPHHIISLVKGMSSSDIAC